MQVKNHRITGDCIGDLSLLMDTAADIVAGLSEITSSMERSLNTGTDVDSSISLLKRMKSGVETLNTVALEITTRLQIQPDGSVGIVVTDDLKVRFYDLMADLQQLLQQESRIESLIAGKGFPLSRRSK